jgi:hypothetical protein
VRRRTLKGIAAFSEERAKRSTFDRARKKQSDADEIKKWEKELKMAFERFSVTKNMLCHLNTRSCSSQVNTLLDVDIRAADVQARTVDVQARTADLQARTNELRDREKERHDQGEFPVPRLAVTTDHR